MSIIGGAMVPHPPVIMKEIGKGREKEIQNTIDSYKKVSKMIKELKPDTIVVISPHSVIYRDCFGIYSGEKGTGNMSRFMAPDVKIESDYDTEFIDELLKETKKDSFPLGIEKEKLINFDHGVMVPLYFINQEYNDYKLVRMGYSFLPKIDNYKMGMYIKKVANDLNKKVFIIASGDLSHKLNENSSYGYVKEGPIYDEMIMRDMSDGDFLNILNYEESFIEKAAQCGHRSFCIMGGTFDSFDLKIEKLSHEGPFGIGYGICTYQVIGENKNNCYLDKYLKERKESITNDIYVTLARDAIKEYIVNNKMIEIPSYVDKEMLNTKRGVFVSIHENGDLRGCIGTIKPTQQCVALEIIKNAIAAATKDFRFNPVRLDEIDYLDINVDVLTDAIPAKKEELNPKKYGIIVSKDFYRGVLLPDIEGVDTVDNQIKIALRKAGLSDEETDYKIERFEVIRHK